MGQDFGKASHRTVVTKGCDETQRCGEAEGWDNLNNGHSL